MEWIKENIDEFGGNPNSITLTGFSAGAASVHLHYFSPFSQNLFNRGMSLSGTAINSFAIQKYPLKKAVRLANALGCDSVNTRLMVDCLKSRPSHNIIEATNEKLQPYPYGPHVIFAPVVETNSKYPFLSEHPYELLKQGKVSNAPWIVSATAEEGLILTLGKNEAEKQSNKSYSLIELTVCYRYNENKDLTFFHICKSSICLCT